MKIKTLFTFLSAAIGVATSAHCGVPPNQIPPQIQERADRLRADLEARGFSVAQGAWKLFTIEDCKYAIAKIGNCLGNNPTAPYVIPTIPLWPDEFVDSKMKDLFGPTEKDTWWTYRLDPREAIVVVGLMPPAGAYFGIQSYVFSREGVINWSDEIYRSLQDPFMRSILFMNSPNASRPLVFSSIGDSNNNVVMERHSGGSFNQDRSLIITPDAVMERQVAEALLRTGVPNRNQIFSEHVSADLVRLGLNSQADDMITLMRYALPNDEIAGNQWREQLPLIVFRVRDKNVSRAAEFYSIPMRETHTAVSELSLSDEKDKLVKAIKERWKQTNADAPAFESLLLKVDLFGPHCLNRTENCLGDSSDADYQISATAGLDKGEVIAVAGTLGTATGNATYTSLAVNQIPALQGVANISHKELAGSASSFSDVIPHSNKFFVQYFARDCKGLDHCFEVTEGMIARGDKVKILQRNYVAPGSTRGPEATLVLNPVLIVLDGAKRPTK